MTARKLLLDVAFVGMLGLAYVLGHLDVGAGDRGDAVLSFRLQRLPESSGIDFRHHNFVPAPGLAHIAPQIAGTGAGVSAVDIDDDGWVDLYATSSRDGTPNALLRNNGDGTFTDHAAAAGLASMNSAGELASQGSVWADFDGDGDRDVFLYGYGRDRLMRQDDGLRFTDVTERAGLLRWANTNAATFFDYDRDGFLDLYVGGYWRDETDLWNTTDTRVMHSSFEFAEDGGSNHLYRNRGDGTFVDVTADVGLTGTRWTYAAVAADFDHDGWPDLYVANDYGSEQLFLNRDAGDGEGTGDPETAGAARRFEALLGAGLEEASKSGMGIALGDVENVGRLAVFVTNISERGYLFQGNNLRLNFIPSTGRMLEMAKDQAADCGWAWGAQFVDLDLDGRQDLFVANGFVSADRERDYWYDMGKISGALGEVFVDAANWPPMEGRSLSGHERSRVLLNQGELAFHDVALSVGVDDRFDGRAVAIADLWNDGTPDVIVANQDGPLLVYRNEASGPGAAPDRHWLGLDLAGRNPNRDGIGATVVVRAGDMVQRHVVTTAVGFCAQNDRRILLGLGHRTTVDRIDVTWPNGTETRYEELAIDQYSVLHEPER